MDLHVKEKVALLDKAIFSGVLIWGIENIKILEETNKIEITASPVRYVTGDGKEFNRLTIEDPVIGRLVAGAKLMKGRRINYCNLDTFIEPAETGNLMCYTVEEYRARLERIRCYLIETYGIHVDFSAVKLKEIEINRTFRLEDQFEKYHRPLMLLMNNLPSFLKNQMDYKKVVDGSCEYQTYYATSKTKQKGTRYLLFKIYNKSKAIENIIVLTDSFMRVELRLVGAEKVQRAFGSNVFAELTDQVVNDYFDNQIEKLIRKPFTKWQQERDKNLLQLMCDERNRDLRHWQTNVLRVLQNREIEKKCPVLLDVEELIQLVGKLGLPVKRRYEVRKNFRKQAQKFETAFCNRDDSKMLEIMDKLTAKAAGNVLQYTGSHPILDGMVASA